MGRSTDVSSSATDDRHIARDGRKARKTNLDPSIKDIDKGKEKPTPTPARKTASSFGKITIPLLLIHFTLCLLRPELQTGLDQAHRHEDVEQAQWFKLLLLLLFPGNNGGSMEAQQHDESLNSAVVQERSKFLPRPLARSVRWRRMGATGNAFHCSSAVQQGRTTMYTPLSS